MSQNSEASEKIRIQELCAKYCHLLDGGRMKEWQALFALDGAFEVPAFGWRSEGRSEVSEFIKKILPFEFGDFKHLPSSHAIEIEADGNHGTGVLDFQFVVLHDQEPVIAMVGFYEDSYVRDGSTWLFERRRINPMMVGSSLTAALAEKGAL